ncbi:MAG TPA: enoyl-CoA hydratase/isomerase family protein [Solirubrobacteraceae bacterium]|nr:enoyl-CoA hydratase/isomerase family protein [Solirubrobacteraceae bacterium]
MSGVSGLGPWRLDREGPLAVLTIDKPPLNLFDQDVFDGVVAAVEEVRRDPPRALLLRAEGRVWTGGVDVHMFKDLTPETGGEVWRRGFELVQAVEDLPFPVIFAAHSLTLTWGFELALACDLVVAAEGAQFGLVEIVVGLTPSMGGPQRLAEKAGPNRAKDLVMSGQLFDAATMREWGVVTRVWPDAEFDAKARRFAERLANGPTVAHAATKRIVAAQKEGGARAADEIVPELSGSLFATEDLQRAVASFLEHGPGHATYEGR